MRIAKFVKWLQVHVATVESLVELLVHPSMDQDPLLKGTTHTVIHVIETLVRNTIHSLRNNSAAPLNSLYLTVTLELCLKNNILHTRINRSNMNFPIKYAF